MASCATLVGRVSALAVAVAAAFSLALVPSAGAQAGGVCLGEYQAASVPVRPGPPLRFGTVPSGAAGQIGPVSSAFLPDRPDRILAALAQLRPDGAPFVTHSYSSWKDAGPAEDARLLELAQRYTSRGYLWEVVLRYYPKPEREGDVAGFAEHVRRMVRLLGANERVVSFQIGNEVNFTASPDSSDGAFAGARDALIQGVIAGHDEAAKLGYSHLEFGFNWIYRLDTYSERTFWEHLRDRGGPAFVRAVDWIGLDAYPGTFFPPSAGPGQERDFVVNALSLLRCYSASAGIPASRPIHVQENGYPTGAPPRTYERQEQALRTMVQAFYDFRGTYNVTDHRWFNLRDAETASPNFQQQYGLMRDDYTPKPAFGAYGAMARNFTIRAAEEPGTASVGAGRRRLVLRVRGPARRAGRGGRRCYAPRVRASVSGPGRTRVRRVDFLRGRRRLARDSRAPFRRVVRLGSARRQRLVRVRARLTMSDGSRLALARRVRVCPARR